MKHFAGIACGIARAYQGIPLRLELSNVAVKQYCSANPNWSRVKNGSLVFYQDAGYQDAEQKARSSDLGRRAECQKKVFLIRYIIEVKMSGDTIVRLFSMTKAYALSPEFVAVDSFTVQGRSKGPWGNSAPGALNHNGELVTKLGNFRLGVPVKLSVVGL
ncbi:hypothetical protein AK812_SmicGene23778 [Symbiodinium microadriaticum]|uniref:Uncharacterized protein n=1 Tax=Symbiodinium microadriaticum TaxID=2951 RepID=A0A1Q9DGE5_SYMMI|nr:hypothetical protein AK812_SmicGene23778 [Symbiodinium microadriaticum]